MIIWKQQTDMYYFFIDQQFKLSSNLNVPLRVFRTHSALKKGANYCHKILIISTWVEMVAPFG